jgi:hypothetical protein
MRTNAMKHILRFLLLTAFVSLAAASSQTVSAAPVTDATPRAPVVAAPALAPNAQGCSGTPTIQFGYANPAVINAGQVTTLYWGLVGNANAAFLQHPNGHREGIGTPGSKQVNPTQTSTYLVVGVCGGNEATLPITVTVNNSPGCNGQPQMNGFTANPANIRAGQSATLSWGPVLNAQYVQLSSQNQGGSGVPAPGSVQVSPNQTTTYYLTAWCQGNSAQLQVTVNVSNPPPPTPPPGENRITGITKNGSLTNNKQLVVTANYFWSGQDAPANAQATAYNAGGQVVGRSNATRIDANREFYANLRFAPYPPGMTRVTACIIGSSGTELVCQTVGMQ